MSQSEQRFSIEVENTTKKCPIGETVGNRNIREARIPVLSCEGACIRGEIARLAANLVAREEGFARACHGELLAVPRSAMAEWVRQARQVALIDGCALRCHGRILESLLGKERLVQFNALAVYRKYTDLFDIDAVPEEERLQAAKQVAESVLAALRSGGRLSCVPPQPHAADGDPGACSPIPLGIKQGATPPNSSLPTSLCRPVSAFPVHIASVGKGFSFPASCIGGKGR